MSSNANDRTTGSPFPILPFPRNALDRWRQAARTAPWVTWALVLILFALPLAAYWNTTFHHFGFRDDYANLSEAHEQPGKIVAFTASHARPLYGVLLQQSFKRVGSIHELQWLRFAGAAGLGLVAVMLFGLLLRLGWNRVTAAFTAAMVTLTPSAQVIASWATAWPYTVPAILSLGGFMLTDRLGAGRWKEIGWMGAVLLVALGALSYQPSSLFYLVGVAAALPSRREWKLERNLRWAGLHLIIVFLGLAVAFLTMKALYAAGVFEASKRLAFEHDPVGKFWWFLREPLLNAINVFFLNDNQGTPRALYVAGAGAAALLVASPAVEWLKGNRQTAGFWLLLLLALPIAAHGVNLVAAERWATYRTVFTLTSVLLVFLVLSWNRLCGLAGRQGRFIELAGYAVAMAMAIHLARTHPYYLIAIPQGEELQILDAAADRVAPRDRPVKIYFVQPPDDGPTEIRYHDEFGSLSTNASWTPKEMFKHLMRERFPDTPDHARYYRLRTGFRPLPEGEQFDLVIDMHKDMRELHKLGPFYAESHMER